MKSWQNYLSVQIVGFLKWFSKVPLSCTNGISEFFWISVLICNLPPRAKIQNSWIFLHFQDFTKTSNFPNSNLIVFQWCGRHYLENSNLTSLSLYRSEIKVISCQDGFCLDSDDDGNMGCCKHHRRDYACIIGLIMVPETLRPVQVWKWIVPCSSIWCGARVLNHFYAADFTRKFGHDRGDRTVASTFLNGLPI